MLVEHSSVFGARDPKVVEPGSWAKKSSELTVAVEIVARWKLPKIDPEELYRLRYEEGIPVKELAVLFERAVDTIFSILWKVKQGKITP